MEGELVGFLSPPPLENAGQVLLAAFLTSQMATHPGALGVCKGSPRCSPAIAPQQFLRGFSGFEASLFCHRRRAYRSWMPSWCRALDSSLLLTLQFYLRKVFVCSRPFLMGNLDLSKSDPQSPVQIYV